MGRRIGEEKGEKGGQKG